MKGGRARSDGLARFVDASLRGSGQVMLQNNPVTGLLFLLGIFYDAFVTGRWQAGVGALVGLLVSTATATVLESGPSERASIGDGLYGYNGILVGVALPTFLAPSPATWLLVVLGAAVSTIAMRATTNVLGALRLSALTFPFLLTTWLFLLSARALSRVPLAAVGPPSSFREGPATLVFAVLEGVSQVFLIGNAVSGAIFLVALAVSSLSAAIFALLGAVVGLVVALLFGADANAALSGLYGYCAVLTAVALGSVFDEPSVRGCLYTLLGVAFTVVVQAAMNAALAPFGVPTLTAPFVLATWLFLLSRPPKVAA